MGRRNRRSAKDRTNYTQVSDLNVTKPDWTFLPQDVLSCLAQRLTSFKDYVAFRAVCRAWRSAATKQKFSTSQQIPLLVLFGDRIHSEGAWRFYSIAKDKTHQSRLPNFQPRSQSHICSSLGWMMGREENDNQDNLYLWHPLTRAQIQLPNLNIDFSTAKFALSSTPSWTSNYAIVVIFNECSDSEPIRTRTPCNLAFLKTGALAWTKLKLSQPAEDITFYKGQFYVVVNQGRLVVLDVKNPNDGIKIKEIVSLDYVSLKTALDSKYPPNFYSRKTDQYYIVESEGALLLIQRNNVWRSHFLHNPEYEIVEFHVFEVNITNKTLVRLRSLGDKTLFVGGGPCLSVNVKFSSHSTVHFQAKQGKKKNVLVNASCKANRIYFNMGYRTGVFDMNIGFYDQMQGRQFETLKHEGVRPFIPLPWLQQSF